MGVNVGNVMPLWFEAGVKKHGLAVSQGSPLRHKAIEVTKPQWDAMKDDAPNGKTAFRDAMPPGVRAFYDTELLVDGSASPPIDEQEDARVAYADPDIVW